MLSLRKYTEEAIGWIGAGFSLAGFSLNSLNVVGSQSMKYLTLNLVGCFFLILYGFFKKA